MLDTDWVRENACRFDVFHIHFGFDARPPRELEELVGTLKRLRKPLVYTAHDLRNPHHADGDLHCRQLDVLIPAADAVITLTPGTAAEIRRRFGREVTVLPHPHVVADHWRFAKRPQHPGFVVGVHAKSLRASMDPGTAVQALLELKAELPRLRIRVDVHNDVATEGTANHDPRLLGLLRAAGDRGALELHQHDCFSDEQLWEYLIGLDVSLLPYRFGTHSGWLEACHDLGTPVIAPDCGSIHEQRPCFTYSVRSEAIDRESLKRAVRAAYSVALNGQLAEFRALPAVRDAERRGLAGAHRLIYERAIMAARRAGSG